MIHPQRSLTVLSLAISGILAAFAPAAQAQSLVELYDSARAFDATYLSAKLQYDANLARAEQSRASILPTASLSGTATLTDFDTTLSTGSSLIRSFNTQGATLSASHPLYRPSNRATFDQGQKQLTLARAQLDAAEQELIVRTSQTYFDALASQDSLNFVKAQKAAVAEQLASAKRNFEVGTATITDTREAQARFDLVLAQEIAAENDLRVKKIALDQLVGKQGTQPRSLAAPPVLQPIQPADVNTWVQLSEGVHPSIRVAQSNLEIAKLEVTKAEAGHKPTLDLTGSYNITRNPSGTSSSTATFNTNTATIGLSLNVPLFAGFSTQNRIRETLSLSDKASSD